MINFSNETIIEMYTRYNIGDYARCLLSGRVVKIRCFRFKGEAGSFEIFGHPEHCAARQYVLLYHSTYSRKLHMVVAKWARVVNQGHQSRVGRTQQCCAVM